MPSIRLAAILILTLLTSCASAPRGSHDIQQFHITPVRPVEELRIEALAATPPIEEGSFRPSDLVEVISLDPTIRLDIRYATSNNFLGTPLYEAPRAFLQRPAAEAVVRVHRALAAKGYGLLIHDAYRPWYITKIFWDATPPDKHQYVADPAHGSRHNRGCAVDLTLFDRSTGRVIEMPSGYDEMSERAHPDYTGGTDEQRKNRDLLRNAMETEGFAVYEYEWWHFDYKDWHSYAVENIRFADIPPSGPR
ncbi:MAG TPA: M15 family metallopeptidase [Thermoanaerobaculia bacterium]